jgi:hypothetical protein
MTFMAVANKEKLQAAEIKNPTTKGHLLKPSESFIKVVNPNSKIPARMRASHGCTIRSYLSFSSGILTQKRPYPKDFVPSKCHPAGMLNEVKPLLRKKIFHLRSG